MYAIRRTLCTALEGGGKLAYYSISSEALAKSWKSSSSELAGRSRLFIHLRQVPPAESGNILGLPLRAVSGLQYDVKCFFSGPSSLLQGESLKEQATKKQAEEIGWKSEPKGAAIRVDKSQETQSIVRTGGPEKGEIVEEIARAAKFWDIEPKTYTRADGSVWPWRSFKPGETYTADTSIDPEKHHVPKTFSDKAAYHIVKAMRVPTDLFFRKRYGCRAMMLETVAGVPGMVGGMLLHLRSLRSFEHSGGWIKALLDEAENERMHLMTFMEVAQPLWWERALVLVTQGVFFNVYFVLYLLSPRIAHRVVGYLEEEACHSYTSFLEEIDAGNIPNVRAPAIARDYWQLPEDATLRDVVLVVRADEAHHRDVNHFASEIRAQGKHLSQFPAPVGHH
eukprot:jgi/Mesen1/10673/ME000009S10459